MFSYELNLSNEGINMSVDSVTAKVEKINTMTRGVAKIYRIDEWTGLESV